MMKRLEFIVRNYFILLYFLKSLLIYHQKQNDLKKFIPVKNFQDLRKHYLDL